jgi:hypothetical protein
MSFAVNKVVEEFHRIHRDCMVFQNPLLIIDTERRLDHVWVFPDP